MEILGEEVILKMILVTSRLRHRSLMATLNRKNYIDWVQAIERIIELKEYNGEKALKLFILKLRGYASLWCETLKKNRVRETKSKIMTWYNLKKHLEKRFLPPSYKQELYLKVTSLIR